MTTTALDDKIRSVFGEFAVDKGLIRRMGVSGDDRHVPSYVMDWIVTYTAKTQKTTSSLERAVQEFIAKHLPAKGEKERIRFKLAQGEVLTVLDAISVTVKLSPEIRYLASIPCLDENKASIEESLLVQNEGLLQGSTWGAAKICYDASDNGGGVKIIDFKPMQAGRVSLEAYCEARHAFTDDEWIALIIRTLGYEPTHYGQQEKTWLLCRLIPIVHNRINMMELAPPGSGKSYVYNNVSRHVLSTTGDISPAVLFYNRQSKMPGVLTRYDLLVLDEAQSIHFSRADEIQAQLKGHALVTEYADGGSLWDLLGGDEATDETRKPLDEKTVKAIAADILAGLAALHEHEIVHRDIKPQNILRCDDVWKIADFGISKLMNNPVTGYTFQGAFTAPWAPPEQITGAPAHPSADVYAWARVVGYMLTGRTSVEKTLSVEPAWREILAPCVDFHAENRPAVSKLIADLERLSC